MKFIYLFSLLLVLQGQQVQAQLSISPNQTATFLANKLVATSGTLGVTVSNAVLTCDSNGNGTFSGSTNLSISDGIVLGTGDVLSNSATSTFGLNGHAGDFASASFGTAGDTQLGNVIGATTYDACVLEMDLQPVGSFMEFEYIFGSEEYPSFNCTPFNDVFAFFISGPGISVPQNIALLPGTNVPVSINSINDSTSTSGTPCAISSSLYVPNTDTFTTMNGFTQSLTAHINVTPGSVYHLKLAIADVMGEA